VQGFELKRRGELKLIKVFQSEVSTFHSHNMLSCQNSYLDTTGKTS